jgi:hypothetical protein
MEIIVAWFWVIKLIMIVATVSVIYKAFVVHEFKRTSWNIFAAVLTLLAYIQPFKMSVDTQATTTKANTMIQQSKVLPQRVDAPAFKHTAKPIAPEDLE